MTLCFQVLRRSCGPFGRSLSLLMRAACATVSTIRPSDSLTSGRLPYPPQGNVFLQTLPRFVSVSAALTASEEDLELAKQRVTQLKEDPGNEVKLKLYGLYKQVHIIIHIHMIQTCSGYRMAGSAVCGLLLSRSQECKNIYIASLPAIHVHYM